MTIKEKIESIVTYYMYNRKVGNTRLLKEGTKNYDGPKLILAYSKQEYGNLECKEAEVVSFKNDGLKALISHNKPLVIDNGALYKLLEETLVYINELEVYKEQIIEIQKIIK